MEHIRAARIRGLKGRWAYCMHYPRKDCDSVIAAQRLCIDLPLRIPAVEGGCALETATSKTGQYSGKASYDGWILIMIVISIAVRLEQLTLRAMTTSSPP